MSWAPRVGLLVGLAMVWSMTGARADDDAPRPIVGFRVEGDSKVTRSTLAYLAHIEVGDFVTDDRRPELERALISSELFKSAIVRFEPAPDGGDGVIVVATLVDKHSWIVVPTLYLQSDSWAAGIGFAENNLFGENKKLALYAQLGSINSLLVGAFVAPSLRGSRMSLRLDMFLQRRVYGELENPPDDPSSSALLRTSVQDFLNFGAAAGWNWRWWLNTELRLRGAAVTYDDPHVAGDPSMPLPAPSPDGMDITTQARVTLDRREHRLGVTDGHYAQLMLEATLPGVSDYQYAAVVARTYLSWRFLGEHELELRGFGNIGYHLPFHDEWTIGAANNLRGLLNEQYRGDIRAVGRAEYSVPLTRWKMFSFRALTFFDTGYIGFHLTDPDVRDYLPNQVGYGVWRNDVGGGFRIYFSNIVLPLVGFDVGYGIERRAYELYFQLGLTDF